MQLSIYFAEILHAGRGAIDMKNIKLDFRLKAWVRSPGIDWGVGPRPIFFFLEYGLVAYYVRANHTCSNMVAIFLPADTPSTPGRGSKGQTISFSESSHVAYQKKGNWAQSTMKASMPLFLHTPLTPGLGSKGLIFFLTVVMLHIKL